MHKQALFSIHSAVLLFALSGLFAKWLAIPATYIVFGRAAFAAVALSILVIFIKNISLNVGKAQLFRYAVTGLLLALHWVSFFAAIQFSSVTIGLITFATFPIFVGLIEPLFFKEKYSLLALIQSLVVGIGVYLVLPEVEMSKEILQGASLGVFSAFTFALLTISNRKFVAADSPLVVAFYQNLFAAIMLTPLLFFFVVELTSADIAILLLLGVVFTALSHSLFNYALTHIKAITVSIAVSLEPVYGILAAITLLGETLTAKMLLGIFLVLATNAWVAFRKA